SPYAPPSWTAGTFRISDDPPEPIPADVSIPTWLLAGTPRDKRPYVVAYDDEIAAADVAFDALRRGLDDARCGPPLAVVLTADHGEQLLDHGGWEHSSNLHDELIHVPLVIRAPGFEHGVVHAQVQLIDIFPTLLELARAAAPSTAGRSLTHVLRDSSD